MTNRCLCGDPECSRCFPLEYPHEVLAAAKELARKGLTGKPGDPLPNLMSAESSAWINDHLAAFQLLVWSERA